MKRSTISYLLIILIAIALSACGGGDKTEGGEEKSAPQSMVSDEDQTEASIYGVGPIQSEISFGDIDATMASEGEKVFTQMCVACHKMDKRHVGPALTGVIDRRNPEWVMNMILNPENMVKEDPVAKELFAEYLSPMANQNLTEDQARAVLEYFRQYDLNNQ